MRGEERLYWVKDIGEPVSMEEILSGEIELPEDFRVETHLGIPNLVERPDLVDRVSFSPLLTFGFRLLTICSLVL